MADGASLRAQLAAGVHVTLGVDLTLRAGSDASGRVYLDATNPLDPGSSISHWDPIAFPDLLMEPNINPDLPHDVDLTLPLLQDIGWESAPTEPPPDTREAIHRAPRAAEPRDVGPRP